MLPRFNPSRSHQIHEDRYLTTGSFLTLLDDLPRGIAIACTSNCRFRDFEERFQTRFQAIEIAPPTTEEIIALLRRYLPDEPEIINAATFADGNVRQALLDVKGLVQRSIRVPAA